MILPRGLAGADRRHDRVPFLLLAALTWAMIAWRAWSVPLVHDECASILWYVQPGEWRPYHAHWDANDHYLVSALGILAVRLFGLSAFALRLTSVLAFGLYGWAAWQLGHRFGSRVVRWAWWSAALCCPFLFDFFSLFRGYGLEMAGWLFALEQALRFLERADRRSLVQALCALIVASGALISLLPAWLLLFGLLLLRVFSAWRSRDTAWRMTTALIILLVGLVPLAYAVRLAWMMRSLGLLYNGSTAGFVAVTVRSLAKYILGSDAQLVVLGVAFVALASGALVMWLAWRARSVRSTGVVVHFLLWAHVIGCIVLATGWGVNFPEDRSALHLVPLVVLGLLFAVDALGHWRPALAWMALLVFVLPGRWLFTWNTDHTLLWPEQSVPLRFAQEVRAHTLRSGGLPTVGSYHQLKLAWPMNARLHGLSVPAPQVADFPRGLDDLRIVDGRFLAEARVGYRAIDSAMGPGLWLLERDRPLTTLPLDTLRVSDHHGNDEFVELAQLPCDQVRRHDVSLEVRAVIDAPGASPDLQWVVEVNDSTGAKLHYEATALGSLRATWQADTLCAHYALTRAPEATRAVIYVHNARRMPLSVRAVRVVWGELR